MTAQLLVIWLWLTMAPAVVDTAAPASGAGGAEADVLQNVCLNCHAGIAETPEARPHSAGMQGDVRFNVLSRPEQALDIVIIDRLAQFYGPVPFSHKIHADMSEISGGCTNCHHNPEEGGQIAACVTCHVPANGGGTLAQPGLKGAYHRQCLGCHRDWAHENACGYCHEEQSGAAASPEVIAVTADAVSTPHPRIAAEPSFVYRTSRESAPLVTFHHVDHAESFGLRCIDCHQDETCGSCHDVTTQREAINHVKSCCCCHAEKNCEFCHDTEERPDFDHAALTGWPLESYHAAAACTDCHGPVNDFKSPPTSCRSCHSTLRAGSFDHGVTGVPLFGSHAHYECDRCHRDGEPGSPTTCNGCHPDITYPPHLPGRRSPDGQN
jgi:hypothetical protein